MTSFWLGTLPTLTVVMLGVRQLAGRWRVYLPVATSLLLIGTGTHLLVNRAGLSIPASEQPPWQPASIRIKLTKSVNCLIRRCLVVMPTDTMMTPSNATMSDKPSVACWHCASPVPFALVNPAEESQFCCHGCRTAYEIIHECGLDRYYSLRENGKSSSTPTVSIPNYEEMDDPVFQALHVTTQSNGISTARLFCKACIVPRVFGSSNACRRSCPASNGFA